MQHICPELHFNSARSFYYKFFFVDFQNSFHYSLVMIFMDHQAELSLKTMEYFLSFTLHRALKLPFIKCEKLMVRKSVSKPAGKRNIYLLFLNSYLQRALDISEFPKSQCDVDRNNV